MTELKPCPFCGRTIHIVCKREFTGAPWDVRWVHDGTEKRRVAFQNGERVDFCIIEEMQMITNGDSEGAVCQEVEKMWNQRVEEEEE